MKLVRTFLTALILSSSALALASALAANFRSGQAQILGSVDLWVTSWNSHNAKALGNLLTRDVDFVLVNGKALKGRAEFERLHAEQFEGRYKRSHFVLNGAPTIEFVRPDVAIVLWRWTITDVLNNEGSAAPVYHGIFTWIEVRDGGAWRIRAAQNTVDKD